MYELTRPTKRLRLDDDQNDQAMDDHGSEKTSHNPSTISISTSPASASQAVAPFLTKHIPEQYAPRGQPDSSNRDPSTKYCYRHRPDLKCRRQPNEPSMDMLQRVGT